VIEKAILATDLAVHFQHVDKFIEKSKTKIANRFETPEEKELLLNIKWTENIINFYKFDN